MLGKVWKKVLFFVLIIACVFNVMIKLVKRTSLKNEIESTIPIVSIGEKAYRKYLKQNFIEKIEKISVTLLHHTLRY